MVGGSPAENLSEQYIFYYGSVEGDSQINLFEMQADGMSPDLALDAMISQRIGLYYESSWNYNQSDPSRFAQVNPSLAVLTYPNSCTSDYSGEECSDYTWQTVSSVLQPGIPEPGRPPVLPSTPVHRVTSNAYLPGAGGGSIVTEYSLQNAILLLASDMPLVVTMNVTEAFVNTTDGYVRQSAGDPVLGSHAMELVGFVPNNELPAGVQPATREGFFIVKNSWGALQGDCGFYYLDFAYVKTHLGYLNMLMIS